MLHTDCSAQSLEKKLRQRITATWQRQELATALQRLASAGDFTLWLDRRIDRQQRFSVHVVDQSLERTLSAVTAKCDCSFTKLASLVYVGPEQTTAALPALIKQARLPLRKLPSHVRRSWMRADTVSWPRLSEPRALVQSWLTEAKIELVGDQQIPHDLWTEQSLPAMPLVDRLVLTLVGFDLTCRITDDGKRCQIVPIDYDELELSSSSPTKKPKPQQTRRSGATDLSKQRFTLRLNQQPLGLVLDKLAEQLQLTYDWQTLPADKLRQQLVSCDVKNADLDELLRVVFNSANLRHRRDDNRVTIEASR